MDGSPGSAPDDSGPRPFRFALGGPVRFTRAALADHARKAEDLGFSTLFVSEHVGEQLAPVPAMMVAALATATLRVGSLVFNSDHHNAVMLAQQAASIDLLTDGRLEVGLGAGWYQPDYELTGTPFGSAAERIDRLRETSAIVRRLLAPGSADGQSGDDAPAERAIRLESAPARLAPRPAQRPRVPLLIGGGGRRLLSVAARYADIVDLAPRRPWPGRLDSASVTAAATSRKLEWLRAAAPERAGTHELSVYPALTPPRVTRHGAAEIRELATQIRDRYPGEPLTAVDLATSPHVLVGSVESLAEKLLGLREQYGISYLRVPHEKINEFAPLVARLGGR